MLASSEQNDSTSVTGVADLVHRVERDGFAVVLSCLNEEVIQSFAAHLSEGSRVIRGLVHSSLRHFATGTVG
jgi:hypothetical protein